MKNINLLLTTLLLTLSGSAILAETATNTVTKSVTIDTVKANANTPAQSITYSTTTTTTGNSDDEKLVAAVYAQYSKDPALIGTSLTVNSQNGVVTISGTVTAQSQADEASIAAKKVPGVQDVISNIKVTTNPGFNKSSNTIPNY